eukprot:6682963-Alexandrium_andersonii.AAC.1
MCIRDSAHAHVRTHARTRARAHACAHGCAHARTHTPQQKTHVTRHKADTHTEQCTDLACMPCLCADSATQPCAP